MSGTKPLDGAASLVIRQGQEADLPSGDAATRIWEGVSRGLDAPLSPAAASAAKSLGAAKGAGVATGFASAAAAKVVIGGIALGVLVGGYAVFSSSAHENAQAPVTEAQSRATKAPGPHEAARLAAAPSAEAPPPSGEPREPMQAMPGKKRAAPPRGPAGPPSYLLEETQLMVDAQRWLNGGAPDRALALLERHRALFPGGKLAQERDAARILALCALGRSEEARRSRDRFEQNWPNSALSRRVRAACAGGVEPTR